MENIYLLHEQIMYESIMDGCLYLGDEFVSMIEGELTSKRKQAIVESIHGHLLNNCVVYGISDPDNFPIKESMIDSAISNVLKERKYKRYPDIYGRVLEVAMWRANMLRSAGKDRVKASKKIGAEATKNLKWANKKLGHSRTSFNKAKDSLGSRLYGDSAKQAIRGVGEFAGAVGGAALGGGRRLQSKYYAATGKKWMAMPRKQAFINKKKEEERERIRTQNVYT